MTLTLSGDAHSVRLTVHNDGLPIPVDAIPTLFDPLVRSPSEDLGEPTTSLGLGLFIVKQVVDAHQGTIEISSNEADGTTFTVVLPRKVQTRQHT
ncbi:Sensor protein ZraS [compost metagenome]